MLWNRSHGIDDREVQVTRIRKSVGVERTFEYDISDQYELETIIVEKLLPELKRRSSKYLATRAMNKLGVKVKFSDFQQTTKDQKASEISLDLLKVLLAEALIRGQGKSVRLLGVHIGLQEPEEKNIQLGLEF